MVFQAERRQVIIEMKMDDLRLAGTLNISNENGEHDTVEGHPLHFYIIYFNCLQPRRILHEMYHLHAWIYTWRCRTIGALAEFECNMYS